MCVGRYRLRARALLALAVLSLVLPASRSAQQSSFGPLTYEEGSPVQRISYAPMMENANVVEHRTLEVSVYNGFSNIFEQDSTATHVLYSLHVKAY